jgi:uncharacterized protein (TIGR03067 family)
MMHRAIVRLIVGVAFVLILAPSAVAQAAGPSSDAERLAGTWLFDAAWVKYHNNLSHFWTSTLVVTGDSFAVSKFMEIAKDLTGKFVLNPEVSPKTIDLKIDEFDLSERAQTTMKIPACTLPGIYKFEGDRLTVCFPIEADGKRPATFDDAGDKVARIVLARAAGFKAFPKVVVVKVTDADGQPVAGATVADFMDRGTDTNKTEAEAEWRYSRSITTGTDGRAKVKYEQFRHSQVVVHHAETKRIAIVPVTPRLLANGEVAVTLTPERRVTGTIVSPELTEAGLPIEWTGVYAMQDGRRVALCNSKPGDFEFLLPPGAYALDASGSDLNHKIVNITVPAGRSEFAVGPITLSASVLARLQKRPAPEFVDVVAWKGQPVKLADLKGKYVLLEFWGYWCSPCVHSMPVLIELHEKFGDKGLVIVGVHADLDGEVDTVAKLDEKIAGFKKKIWKGKDLPFSVAITSGKQVGEGDAKEHTGPAGQYGVHSWPTCVLIDRDGKVVGKFQAHDAKAASEEVEKLLNAKK